MCAQTHKTLRDLSLRVRGPTWPSCSVNETSFSFLSFSLPPPFWCQGFVLNVNNLARSNNKSMLTLTLAPFVPIMLLPSAEDLCIFDIKFLLSSRLLSCWLFLTRRPRSPNFPIFNAGRAHPRPQTPVAPPQLNSVGLLLLACAVCTVLELQCAALSPSCTLKPTEQRFPLITSYCSQTEWLQFTLTATLQMIVWTSYFSQSGVGWGKGYYQVPRGP